MGEKNPSPRPRRPRLTLKAAREEARRVEIEAWAWQRLYATLRSVVERTARGVIIPPDPR